MVNISDLATLTIRIPIIDVNPAADKPAYRWSHLKKINVILRMNILRVVGQIILYVQEVCIIFMQELLGSLTYHEIFTRTLDTVIFFNC